MQPCYSVNHARDSGFCSNNYILRLIFLHYSIESMPAFCQYILVLFIGFQTSRWRLLGKDCLLQVRLHQICRYTLYYISYFISCIFRKMYRYENIFKDKFLHLKAELNFLVLLLASLFTANFLHSVLNGLL